MNIEEFVGNFNNHPILFVGSGMSLRYLNNSYNWDDLLKNISFFITNNDNYYLDLKNKVYDKERKIYDMPKLGEILEKEFDNRAMQDDDGRFSEINKIFYESMGQEIQTSRLKIYISQLLQELTYRDNIESELEELVKARKNIGSVITTNYDTLVEDIFKFKHLIGNNILMSNPYGSVYKIHGCVNYPSSIIVTEYDYKEFEIRYELIRAQLLSLFIHNPIIFLGYSISDDNIRKILETIFSYVDYRDELSRKIRNNFLLVEYDKGSNNRNVVEHDITIKSTSIRINKIATDDYSSIYNAISRLRLPISTMDVRKVQSIVGDIYRGGKPGEAIQVRITEDTDKLKNSDTVLVIGSEKTIKYEYRTISEMMIDYFSIIEEKNIQLLELIDKHKIPSNQYFPIHAFNKINPNLETADQLKENQKKKIEFVVGKIKANSKVVHDEIESILNDDQLAITNKEDCIIWNVMNENIDIEDLKKFLVNFETNGLLTIDEPRTSTKYRRLLCVYDFCASSDISYTISEENGESKIIFS